MASTIVTIRAHIFRLSIKFLIALLLCAPAAAQSWQDLAQSRPGNFDKLLVDTDKMIYISPPVGKYWVITAGSFAIQRPVKDAWILIWVDHAPYAPYRDPATGEMKGCHECVNLIRLDAGRNTFVPIVGGYTESLQGQTMPLVISYPNRLMIAVTPKHGGLEEPLQTWTRLTVVQKDLD